MTYDCYCDYGDPPAFYAASQPRARKRYACYECGGAILPGERYERVAAKWDKHIDVIHTCERCYDLRVWTKNNVPCLCIMHGNMDEEIKNAIEYAYDRARSEVQGLWFGYARRLVMRKQHNARSRNK